jgi:cysteine-rich repeat protein
MRNFAFRTTLVLLAGGLLYAGTASAQTSQACSSNKQKAIGKTAFSVLNCYATGAKKGLAVDPACIQKAKDKWTFPAKGAFEKAELKGGCALEGQNVALEGRCSNEAGRACSTTLECGFGSCSSGFCSGRASLPPLACTVNADCVGTCGSRDDSTEAQGLYDMVVDEDLSLNNPTEDGFADNVGPFLFPNPLAVNACQADKLKASGKLAADLTNCEAKAAKKNVAVDPNCVQKAMAKIEKAFAKTEAKNGGGCQTTVAGGDIAFVESSASSFAERVKGAVPRNDGCGSGIVLLPETCDDGNTVNTDTCPSDCIVDACTPNGGTDDPHTVSFTSTKGKPVGALTVFVDYPEGKVSILGSGSAIPVGVIDNVLGDPFTAASFNDVDHGLTAALAEGTGGDFGLNGDLFTVHYETCNGAGAATAGDFTCTVLNAADGTGKPLAGVSCSVN